MIKSKKISSQLLVSNRYKYAILELGKTPTPKRVIETWNEIFAGDEIDLLSFEDGKFNCENGTKCEPKDIFFCIHDYCKG